MQKYILLFLFVFVSLGLSAQIDVEILPNPASASGEPSMNDIKADAVIANNSPNEVRLLWTRHIVDMDDSWRTWVCDANLCYTDAVVECPPNNPVIIAAGDTVILQVHIDPEGNMGTATIDVDLHPFADPDEVLTTGRFNFTVNTSSTPDVQAADIKIFPNPVADYITLTETGPVKELEIYTIVGKRLRTFQAIDGKRYPVADLNNGLYLVSLLDEKRKVIKTIRLSKI